MLKYQIVVAGAGIAYDGGICVRSRNGVRLAQLTQPTFDSHSKNMNLFESESKNRTIHAAIISIQNGKVFAQRLLGIIEN
jgi:hypothetical protein